jgi:hypothetical protein
MARKPSEPSPKSTGSKSGGDGRSAEQQVPAAVPAQIAGEVPQNVGEILVAGEFQAAGEPVVSTEAAVPLVVTRLRKGDGRALILYSANNVVGDQA